MVGVREDPKCAELASQLDEETRLALEKAIAAVEAALARTKEETRARLKAEAALTEARQALSAAQAQFEQERQARLASEQTRVAVERALAQARQAIGTGVEDTEPPPIGLGEEGAERRVTFIVRLTVDQRNQPRRTEIEHAQSGKKETFPGLDAHRLIAFMKACFNLSDPAGTDDSPNTSSDDR